MTTAPNGDLIRELAEPAVRLAASWARASESRSTSAGSRQLGRILRDPEGPAFVLDFVDGVVRPEDERVAGTALRRLARSVPRAFLLALRNLVRLAGVFGPVLP